MKTILLLDSNYPINTRNEKIFHSLSLADDCEIKVCTWNRNSVSIEDNKDYFIYEKTSEVGNLRLKLQNLYGYYIFLRNLLNVYTFDVIIASHWDMLFLSALLKKKCQTLIYENLDIPTSSNKLILAILKWIEKLCLHKTDAIVFASRFFVELYSHFKGEKILIENKPLALVDKTSIQTIKKQNYLFVISYIGLVRYLDILQHLVDAVRGNPAVELNIHGEGQDLEKLKKYANGCTNIHFTGRFEQSDLPILYANADIVWAAYPNKDYNVKYAISNKFHESIVYRTPCIYSEKTKLGDYVLENRIGLVVNPYSVISIKELIDRVISENGILEDLQSNLILFSKNEKTWEDEIVNLKNYIYTL